MNKNLLRSIMVLHGDTQGDLAAAMELSLSRLNAKINECRGAEFTQTEIAFIANRYHLSADEIADVFFSRDVS